MIETLTLEQMKERCGQEMGKSDWLEIDQNRINQFAECTLDYQWIHIDEEKAAAGPFGKTIAHGFLTLSLISYFSEKAMVVPEGAVMAINYGLNKVRNLNPVTVGSRIRDTFSMGEVTEKSGGRILMSTNHVIEIEGQEKPACVAESLVMFFTQ